MHRLFLISEKIHDMTKWKVSSVFLFLNIVYWCLIALVVAILGVYAGCGTIAGHEITIICIVGYTGLIVGFLGGVWYLDRQGM
ncbi:MAG: hypothetical protein PHE06_03005 [Lachnospiraceae bacterium]|nr:hypothetical protein [Lachnospiraceae bacterium]MDD3794937.1 hypothetical protein [Lachnospiraceae bacterium]